MKKLLYSAFLLVLIVGCKTETENPEAGAMAAAEAAFTQNSQTVLANLQGWQNENLDYSMYADDFVMLDTGFGAKKDSISKSEMMAMDQQMWQMFDFKILNEPVLLPGVNSDTKKLDGSVRHYSAWEVTRPATDSTEAKSGTINLYESFDFNEEGKILYQQVYGDFTGLMNHLMGM